MTIASLAKDAWQILNCAKKGTMLVGPQVGHPEVISKDDVMVTEPAMLAQIFSVCALVSNTLINWTMCLAMRNSC